MAMCHWCGADNANRQFKLTTVCNNCFNNVMAARQRSRECCDFDSKVYGVL